jgi:hypothetical protein
VKQFVTATFDRDGEDVQARGEEMPRLSRLIRMTGLLGRAPLSKYLSGDVCSGSKGEPGSALFGLDIDLLTAGVITDEARLEQVFVPVIDAAMAVVADELFCNTKACVV